MNLLERTIGEIRPVDAKWIAAAEKRQLELTKPPGSLGRLEEIANRCAAIRESLAPTAGRARIVVFAGDHGVCAEGVSPYPQEVTAQMVANFRRGGAAINALAGAAGIELMVRDAGACTKNFCVEPAMTEREMVAATEDGIGCAAEAAAAGCDVVGFGEMGIGNTTSASAITAALTGEPIFKVTGRGTGADEECMARKRAAIERALELHAGGVKTPLGILRCLGGFEIAGMCGFCLGAAARRLPVIADGFISTAAAALAVRLSTAAGDYLFASHQSGEPGHAHLLAILGQRPLLDLGMRLGEGTGAALAIPIFRAAIAAFTRMATFAEAAVSNR